MFALHNSYIHVCVTKTTLSAHRDNENDHRLGPRPVAMMGSLLAAVGSFIFVTFGIFCNSLVF